MTCADFFACSGCDVNLQNYNNFDTALHLAAYRGHLDICRLLLSQHAHTTVKNTHGKSAYDEARSQKHQQTANFLYGERYKRCFITCMFLILIRVIACLIGGCFRESKEVQHATCLFTIHRRSTTVCLYNNILCSRYKPTLSLLLVCNTFIMC